MLFSLVKLSLQTYSGVALWQSLENSLMGQGADLIITWRKVTRRMGMYGCLKCGEIAFAD